MPECLKRAPISVGRFLYGIGVTAAMLWAIVFVFGANTKIRNYALIGSYEHSIAVVGSSSLGERYALIQVGDRGRLSNVVLEEKEWDQMLTMWNAARTHQARTWSKIGEIAESDIFNPSHLTISAGVGVRFAIVDTGVCLRYDLSPRDFDAFDRAATRAKRHFTGDDADEGTDAGKLSWRGTLDSTNETFKNSIPGAGPWPECR